MEPDERPIDQFTQTVNLLWRKRDYEAAIKLCESRVGFDWGEEYIENEGEVGRITSLYMSLDLMKHHNAAKQVLLDASQKYPREFRICARLCSHEAYVESNRPKAIERAESFIEVAQSEDMIAVRFLCADLNLYDGRRERALYHMENLLPILPIYDPHPHDPARPFYFFNVDLLIALINTGMRGPIVAAYLDRLRSTDFLMPETTLEQINTWRAMFDLPALSESESNPDS